MIKFKNITGDSFLAVGTIQRKFALNGEKSLSGVLYDGDDVLNSIDKGWSLEFDGEPYVVTYFERNDNDNTLSFDAVHKFFWNMSKSVLYSETSGSHTISWYLDQIFANTGYTYALNFKPKAVSKDNWGMKTKLALFNDIISSISGEFEINGTLISIFEKVGSDLSTIVRYGFNLSDMSIENDAAGFVTYGEGFGAYEDQQNQSGPRLHTTYTSPLASVYGILQAEPVDDQRYTIERNLKDAIKAKIDASFSVSIKLSLYDLTAAGYPYKMAHVGDWLMAIDERLNFKQRIRIISVDDEFDVNGNRISYTVTAGNVGVVQKYQEANASLATQVNNALESANNALDNANIALISASGKNTSYYVDSFDMLPTTANEGDFGWVQAGDGRVLYIYTKKPDGTFYWEKRIDPEMQEQIEASVDKVVSDAKEYSDKLVADNAEQVNRVLSDVQDKQVELKNEQIELDRKAQGYADKALADAKATATVAQQVAQNAQVALNDAETTLRQEINQKVSQADYDEKTGDLTAKVSTAQQTAEQANATIGNYRRSNDGRVSAAESAIQQNANAITSKVSQTAYDAKTGELSGQISTINQKANEITQSVASVRTKVDGMKIGGRNYIKNSDMVTINNNTYMGDLISTLTTSTFSNQSLVLSVQLDYDNITELTGNKRLGAEVLFINNETGANIWFGTWVYPKVGDSFHGRVYNVIKLPDVRDNANNSFRDGMYVQGITGTNVRVSKPKLEIGTMPTDFSAAPENTEQKISTINQTVDSISNVVSNPTTGLSKRVQTAEGALSQVQGTDLPALQRATFWQPYGSLDFNTYTKQGSFFFNTTAAKTNGPTTSTAWIYLVVEQGWSDSSRVTQTAWYDQQGIKTTYRRSLNSGTWTPWYANDNDSVSSIKQTNDAIQSEITNRQTGDTNTLTQAKDFTTSSITRYDLGMQSQLTQTSDSIMPKYQLRVYVISVLTGKEVT